MTATTGRGPFPIRSGLVTRSGLTRPHVYGSAENALRVWLVDWFFNGYQPPPAGPEHRIIAIRTGAALLDPNEAAVFGQGFSALATDTAAQSKAGPVPAQRHDRANTTAPQTTQHAGALLRVVTATTPTGELTVMPNVGQELYDVVIINHAGVGLTNARRRVVRVRLSYSAGRVNTAPRFEQRLTISDR